MPTEFDAYRNNYEAEVQKSISFSGLPHDFFLKAKADFLRDLFLRTFGRERPSMLDVGCGVGRIHPLLRPLTSAIIGCDVSADSLSRAREDNDFADYHCIVDGSLPLPDASVDVSLATCVLHHVSPPDWPHFVREMRRVTRPGGLVIVIEHNPWNPGTRLAVARCPFDRDAVLLSARRARDLLTRASLYRVDSAHILLFPSPRPTFRRIERILSRIPAGAQYCAWGVV